MASDEDRKFKHDVRNVINTISVTAELALLKLTKGVASESIANDIQKILDECRNSKKILERSHSENKTG